MIAPPNEDNRLTVGIPDGQAHYLFRMLSEAVSKSSSLELGKAGGMEILEIIFESSSHNNALSERRKILSKEAALVAEAVAADCSTYKRYLLLSEKAEKMSFLSEVILSSSACRAKSKNAFECITKVHSSMRVDSVLPADEDRLKAYADAAVVMGQKDWVKQGNQWVLSFAKDYFHGPGNVKSYLKRKRGDMSGREVEKLTPFGREKIRLLDVGSCYNPFLTMRGAELFDILALDVCPGHPSVLKCNFLELGIGSPDSVVSISGIGELLSLPSGSYDAVVMSLVLSYLPSPLMRRDMVVKAKHLLSKFSHKDQSHLSGLLMIVEKESIFSKDQRGNCRLASIAQWRAVISSLGFSHVRYQELVTKSNRAHIMIFQAIENFPNESSLSTNIQSQGAQDLTEAAQQSLLYIRQDFVGAESSLLLPSSS